MSSKATPTAAGGSGVGPSRRTWNVEEYTQKARDRDREERQRAQETEERVRKGEKPTAAKHRRRQDLPQPTQELQRRETDLELDKNQGKTLMVDNAAAPGGPKGPGFYCETCNRTFKDSIAYLDHVNGRLHLRKLGQTTQVARSTLEQVRARLLYWQDEMQNRKAESHREYDFERRLDQIAKEQQRAKQEKKRMRNEARHAKLHNAVAQAADTGAGTDAEAMAMMGFGSFGTSKKR